MTEPIIKQWTTESFLSRDCKKCKNALIILNTPLPNLDLFEQIWSNAELKFCADGGANRLYDSFVKNDNDDSSIRDKYLPDLVKGDLDSIRPEVKAYYASKGVPIEHDSSQDTTDLGKCLESLVLLESSFQPCPEGSQSPFQYQLILIGGLSGRLDQTIHTLHTLSILESSSRDYTWCIGKDSLACVLSSGKHEMRTNLKWFGDTCAILPVISNGEAKVKTKGLKWDIGPGTYAYPTSVATTVSTSNHLSNEIIEIETDVPIVWTVEVRGGSD